MKKILSTILSLCLILPLSACSGVGKDELKFRDVSFGTTYQDAIPKLESSGLPFWDEGPNNYGYDYYSYHFHDVDVAGYPMGGWVTFRFADKNNDKLEDSIFTSATYSGTEMLDEGTTYHASINGVDISSNSTEARYHVVRDDLIEKLTDLYGNPSKRDSNDVTFNTASSQTTKATWSHFKDNSRVELEVKLATAWNGYQLDYTIVYTSGREQSILDAMEQAEATPEPTANMNGL